MLNQKAQTRSADSILRSFRPDDTERETPDKLICPADNDCVPRVVGFPNLQSHWHRLVAVVAGRAGAPSPSFSTPYANPNPSALSQSSAERPPPHRMDWRFLSAAQPHPPGPSRAPQFGK